ncbi:MAG TPA: DUF5996 family protein [Pyrinomonadaceae bacterium]|nr:DUF5996 family protein [Pyrinomonadaceae bacterium]
MLPSTEFAPGAAEAWPSLPYESWRETRATLHMWTQVVGKVRLALAPMLNHWWQVPLYVTARGLTTSPMPHGRRTFQIDFDFLDHKLVIASSDGSAREFGFMSRTVADFYRDLMLHLRELGLEVKIWPTPVEIADPVPFEQDRAQRSYDPVHALRLWRALVHSERVFQKFRSGFTGKCSPVHFFWGSFDLAVTRFSGRPAPAHPGAPGVADSVTREAYSHEVSSAGFWPGGDSFPEPVFYSYAYPEPQGFADYRVRPAEAFYSPDLREFVLRYEDVRRAPDPDAALLDFLQSTYEAAADLARWDRAALERVR